MSYLSFLQMANLAAEAFPFVTLLHGHRHGHFHAVCCVPKQITITTLENIGKIYDGSLLTLVDF